MFTNRVEVYKVYNFHTYDMHIPSRSLIFNNTWFHSPVRTRTLTSYVRPNTRCDERVVVGTHARARSLKNDRGTKLAFRKLYAAFGNDVYALQYNIHVCVMWPIVPRWWRTRRTRIEPQLLNRSVLELFYDRILLGCGCIL